MQDCFTAPDKSPRVMRFQDICISMLTQFLQRASETVKFILCVSGINNTNDLFSSSCFDCGFTG